MKFTTEQRVRALREAGCVKRCHVQQHHGEYNVAMHCYGVACLLMELHPNCPAHLYKAALMHDLPERWTGDVPYPDKLMSPKLKNKLNALEVHIQNMSGMALPVLDEEEHQWLKLCDMLELWLWAGEQLEMGNNYARQMFNVAEDKLFDLARSGDILFKFLKDYSFDRGSDFVDIDQWKVRKDGGWLEQESL